MLQSLSSLWTTLFQGLDKTHRFMLSFVLLIALTMLGGIYLVRQDISRIVDARIVQAGPIRDIVISPEDAVFIRQYLRSLTVNTDAQAACMFNYVPIHNIQTKSMTAVYQQEGLFVLQPDRFSDIPLTVDPYEFISMKNQDIYKFGITDLQASPVWGKLLEAGVVEVYSYPIYTSTLYGNISVVFVGNPSAQQVHVIRENLRTTASKIITQLKLR